MSIPVCLVCHDDALYLPLVLSSFSLAGPANVFVSRRAWNGGDGEWERCAKAAEEAGAEVIVGDWPDEALHRRTALSEMLRRGHRHVLIPDGDEVVEPRLLETLLKIAECGIAEQVRVSMDTYWKSPRFVIRPRESLAPVLMLDVSETRHEYIREFEGGRSLVLGAEHGVLHHLSYAGPDERIVRKITTWGHRDEVAKEWYRRVWLGWDADPLMRNLHPTHPESYGFAERIEVPEALRDAPDPRPVHEDLEAGPNWPKISVVIPLYGGEEDIRLCLESLAKLQDLLHEVIVVDDLSPDAAPEAASAFRFVKLLWNQENRGFAATCNRGFEASTGETVLFLNSDTIVPRAGLVRLVHSLTSSGAVAAAGPYTNEAGHWQRVVPTYTALGTMELFAREFAHREAPDREVDMLVGFCLAVRRSALLEVGEFDERFGSGLFEDNDLCYRLRRAGYRLLLSQRAYVHHAGSRSLHRAGTHPALTLRKNQGVYEEKWKEDLESGFASHLSGMSPEPIRFDPSRGAEATRARLRELSRLADVSLTMIVRNEERVLGDCLRSVEGAFAQVVVVDTGSTDRTKEIAAQFGAELYEHPWQDSFAEARNRSLSYAKGKWIFWMDADDTLPPSCAERILLAAIQAPEDVLGYVVPVQFVDQASGGTRVDHVKLFRNLPGLRWEGRIHEQILGSLRQFPGRIGRVEGAAVLHSGYDTSGEGQKKKRERDWKLLELDLKERPNHPFVSFNFGMTHHYCGEHERAIQFLRRSIEAAEPGESHVRKAYSLMGVSRRELGNEQGALETFEEGLRAVGEDPDLRFQGALVLTDLGRLEEAREWYLKVAPDESHFSSVDQGIFGFKLEHNLGLVCSRLGLYKEAKERLTRSIHLAPEFSPSALELFEAALAVGDLATARFACDALESADHGGEIWASCGSRLAQALGSDPRGWLYEACRTRLGAIGPRLLVARSLLSDGREAEAMPVLEDLERLGCAEGAFCLGVALTKTGKLEEALGHMKEAARLNPSHEETARYVAFLTQEIQRREEMAFPKEIPAEKRAMLLGPYAGSLGPAEKRASVVVVSYASERTLCQCLSAALSGMGEEGELIVVDNASPDGTLEVARRFESEDPRVRVIANPVNAGYSKAANAGILASKGEAIALLNPDAYPEPGWLEGLLSRVEPGVGAVGPVGDEVGGEQFAAFHLRGGNLPSKQHLGTVLRRANAGKTMYTKLLMGYCVLLPRAVLNEAGLLDENLPLGADDFELSWRLRLLGYRLVVARDVFVAHEDHVSFASLDPELARSLIAESDEALSRKLNEFYGDQRPNSERIWGVAAIRGGRFG